MFDVRTALDQRDFHIGNLRPCEHAGMLPLQQMREDQTLPVAVQGVLAADSSNLQSAPRFCRLQQQMNFRIMAQRLEMADTLHGTADRLFVYNISGSEFHPFAETLVDQTL